ncbi:MAG TPA: 30S ribosomal protein S9 [Candidatus Dojkabacteria bacterium]|nr:30S ribosomal protein S9 [Candidatus Dojkabacteria bacterium]HQF36616.1 30S ribosomal protein S9 [Candidatus Dojkabacteria bacterium]
MVDKKLKYVEKIGRRKESTARVRIYLNEDLAIINNKKANEYFPEVALETATEVLRLTGYDKKCGYSAVVSGGGTMGQAEAIRLGLARAIVSIDENQKKILKEKGFLTRDPRVVERKKYYLRKARRAPQFSKR